MSQDTLEHPPSTTAPTEVEFDSHAKKGWELFTKFLMGNVVFIILGLVFVAILTVWS
jgi:hypothetical protein